MKWATRRHPFLSPRIHRRQTLRRHMAGSPLEAREILDIEPSRQRSRRKPTPPVSFTGTSKPDNVMIRRNGHVKVLDFGLAKTTRIVNRTEVPLTEKLRQEVFSANRRRRCNGHVTLNMSPEQTRGKPVDGRSDIWSLGVVMYEMVAEGFHLRAKRLPTSSSR